MKKLILLMSISTCLCSCVEYTPRQDYDPAREQRLRELRTFSGMVSHDEQKVIDSEIYELENKRHTRRPNAGDLFLGPFIPTSNDDDEQFRSPTNVGEDNTSDREKKTKKQAEEITHYDVERIFLKRPQIHTTNP